MNKSFFKLLLIFTSAVIATNCSKTENNKSITSPITNPSTSSEHTLKIIIDNKTAASGISVNAETYISGSGWIRTDDEKLRKGVKVKNGTTFYLTLSDGGSGNILNVLWKGDVTVNASDTKKATVNMDSDKTITVSILSEAVTLKIRDQSNGQVDVKLNGVIQSSPYIFTKGSEITLEAKPYKNHKFIQFRSDSTVYRDSKITVIMDENKDFAAFFSKIVPRNLKIVNQYNLLKFTVEFDGKSYYTDGSAPTFEVSEGSPITITIDNPKRGYKYNGADISYSGLTKPTVSNPIIIEASPVDVLVYLKWKFVD